MQGAEFRFLFSLLIIWPKLIWSSYDLVGLLGLIRLIRDQAMSCYPSAVFSKLITAKTSVQQIKLHSKGGDSKPSPSKELRRIQIPSWSAQKKGQKWNSPFLLRSQSLDLSPFMMKILCPLNHLQTGWSPIVPPLTLQPIHNLSNLSSQLKKSFIIIINSSDQLFG